jgi:hypothetical protein
MLKVHTGAQCGKISVQALSRVPLTSRVRQSIVGSHATATVGPRFLAAIIAGGSLHCPEQLPVHKANSAPSIEFTHIPPAAQGGPERVDTISGRVRNARPKQQIVIYAHSGPWWVQPWPPYLGS